MNSKHSAVPATEAARIDAANAVAEASLLTEGTELEQAANTWQHASAIGLDTEFLRERTFRARPGLVQLSDGRQVWLADAVALDRMAVLGQLLADTGKIKILHSVGEDLEVLEQLTGAWPEPLFDTQIAAAMLGLPLQLRYESLVEELLGVHLPGGKARNDWTRRPLADDLLEYAAQDVIWLPALQERLSAQLAAAGRLAWLQEDCQRIVDRARAGTAPPPLTRVKGAGRLPDTLLAVLEPLAAWREDQAAERDLPRRFVLSDEALIGMAETARSAGAERALSDLKPGMRRRHGDRLMALLTAVDEAEFTRPIELQPLDNEARERIKTAQQVVREVAEELAIDPALLASKRELTRIVQGERPDWLDGWRGALLGERLQAASVNIPPPANDPEPR